MLLEDQLFLGIVADQEQGAVGNEEQHRAQDGDQTAGGPEGQAAHEREDIHGGVGDQIEAHGGDHGFGGRGLHGADDHDADPVVHQSHRHHQEPGDAAEGHGGCVHGDEQEMAHQEADAAGGEPAVSLGDQQDIAQPAGQQRGHQDPGEVPGGNDVPSGQQEQEPGLGHGALFGDILPAVVQMHSAAKDVQGNKQIGHKEILSFLCLFKHT